MDHTTVFTILQSQQLKSYHIQRVHPLENVDYEQRWAFCLLFYTKLQLKHTYLVPDMFADEEIT